MDKAKAMTHQEGFVCLVWFSKAQCKAPLMGNCHKPGRKTDSVFGKQTLTKNQFSKYDTGQRRCCEPPGYTV